ncbi:RNA-binding protein spenito-like [Stegodyphus dumicola]|uniref:RNA-binding protein spenito-like n=1 Tax=Stegodyphus dumicola TaxID=202533 RepID=UPI0015AF45B2|nr:RNA-binding protein spenito-like [Stegodyphus dumicola]
MKRQQDRDSPGKKRSHSSVSRYDDSPRDRSSPDRRERRGSNKSPNDQRRGRTRDSSNERGMTISRSGSAMGRDSYDDYSRNMKSERGPPPVSKTLCVSNLNHKVGDAAIRDALLREFNRFGEVSVKIFHSGNERVAYVYFRTYEDARDARHSKARLVLFDKPVQIEPVFDRGVSGRRNRSISPEYSGMRGVSPAHSSASNNSMGRHVLGSRQNAIERNQPYPHPRDEMRRDMHNDFHHHPIHRREDSKKEKFPNYLHHVPPEEDDKATRTLFVGNLEVTISEAELRRIFERYGVVEDIDVKRPAPGLGNAYAFIKFLNLDMAHRGKVEMSGQYIGKFQCKIGYGKATPTTRIWVGGLGPWTSLSHLEREFDRFGAIRKIDFVKGENHAYIQYDSIDAAQAACQEMRGFPLGGQDKRLRVDFADPGPYSYYQSPSRAGFREEEGYIPPPPTKRQGFRSDVQPATDDYYGGLDNNWSRNNMYENQPYDPIYDRSPKFQGRDSWGLPEHEERHDYRAWNRNHQGWWDDHPRNTRNDNPDRRKRGRSPDMDDAGRLGHDIYYKRPRSRSPERSDFERSSASKDTVSPRRNRSNGGINRRMSREGHLASEGRQEFRKDYDYDSAKSERNRRQDFDKKRQLHENLLKDGVAVAESVDNLQDLAKCCPVAWHGGLVLKNSAFPTRMHVCSGDPSLVDYMMKDLACEVPMLRITQRLRLDPPKLDDVSRRISSAGPHGHCLLLTFPGPIQPGEDQSASVQQRPLRNLVSYLKQKEAAGVISLPSNTKKEGKDASGVMYAFPPCSFALDLLRRIAPNLTSDCSKEDHLVVVVVKGSS